MTSQLVDLLSKPAHCLCVTALVHPSINIVIKIFTLSVRCVVYNVSTHACIGRMKIPKDLPFGNGQVYRDSEQKLWAWKRADSAEMWSMEKEQRKNEDFGGSAVLAVGSDGDGWLHDVSTGDII
ncbi:hypothetical protein K439DRAFT_1625463 [Ramaria rubella]|nr:hypothetical protein K439DRAFT_1625463 [Ramaria rubella]